MFRARGIGIRNRGFFTDHVHRLDLALAGFGHHLEIIEPEVVRQGLRRHAPGLGPFLAHRRLIHVLVTGIDVLEAAEVAGALHIVVAAHRIAAGAGPTVIAGHQQQVR